MRRSIWKAGCLLRLLAGLHTAALCRVGTSATAGSITTVPVGGTVRFPVLHHSQERFEVAMGRIHPDLAILAWKSDSPEYPYMVRPSYRDRVHFRRDAFIELRALRPGDQGTYEVQINYLGRDLRNRDRERFELRVVEPMSTPTVEVSRNSSHLTLDCSTVSGCPVTYRWERRSQDPGVGNATFPGAVLYLPDPGQHTCTCTYTCIAEDCCSRRVSDAFPATLLSVALPGGSKSRWAIVLSVFLLAAILLAVILLAVACWETGHRNSAETAVSVLTFTPSDNGD
ncbi:hepatocyte cell adhesion molecule-like [Amblyraja radiata]|uniref:hepatocyte cell adhesion molecule-like n=1 Tax=Amblyraja radiata TaxID=386614 RepID=UPI0014025E61|nr:hepatocyte cell adhesion molecule-like [Amblyraja radiata]